MPAKPLITDINPPIPLNPGDRILVRVSVALSSNQYDKLKRAVEKWAGVAVRVLIVNVTKTRILLHRFGGAVSALADPTQADPEQDLKLGLASLDCSVVELNPNDQLVVQVPYISSDQQKKIIFNVMREWTGRDVEVIIEGGLQV